MPTKIERRKTHAGSPRFIARFRTPDGAWLSAGTFATKEGAQKAATVAEHDASASQWLDPRKGKIAFAAFVATVYLPTIKVLEVSTQDGIKGYLRKHLVPRFGSSEIGTIRPSDVQRWISEWDAAKTNKPATLIKAHSILHKILGWAVKDGLLPSNPCAGTNLPVIPEREVRIMLPEQFDAFYDQLPDARDRAMVLLAMETGMRWSELVAFTPGQMLPGNRIVIDRGLTEVVIRNNGYRWERKPYPKGRKPRSVVVSEECISALAAYDASRARRTCKCCTVADPDRELFLTTSGGHPDASSFRTTHLQPAMARAGLGDLKFTMKHLRSSFCSWMLAEGVPAVNVQKFMGHKHLNTTQHYIQVLPEAEEAAAQALATMRARRRKVA